MREELLKGLTDEQINKLKECKTQEERLQLAKDEGMELTDEQLEAVNGGNCLNDPTCPNCGDRVPYESGTDDFWFTCPKCGKRFRNDSSGHMF